jgi:hypothetical protein
MNAFSVGGLIAWSLAIAACNHGVSRETQAVVLSVDGDAASTHARDGQTRPIRDHSHLSIGDLVKTNGQGQLRLMIVPGILIAVKPDSEFKIEALRVTKDGNAMKNAMLQRKARIRVTRGMVDAVVQKKDAAGATLVLETPFGTVNAPGECVFRSIVSDQGGRVLCIRGALQVQRDEGHSTDSIAAGFYSDFGTNSDGPKPADQNGEVQSEVMTIFESMQQLLAAQTQEIFRPAPWRHSVTGKP